MREFLAKTRKVGDSLAVILPLDIVQAEQIGADMIVKVVIQKCQTNSKTKPDDACSLGPENPWGLLE